MLNLPKNTEVNFKLLKTKIFDFSNLNASEKKLIDKKISYLKIVNQISYETIPTVNKGMQSTNINFIFIKLKEDMTKAEVSVLFESIRQTIVLILHKELDYKVAIKYNDVMMMKTIDLNKKILLRGNDIDKIYENIIIDLFDIELIGANTLNEQLLKIEKNERILNEIKVLERRLKKEVQFNKKVEINNAINILKMKTESYKRKNKTD